VFGRCRGRDRCPGIHGSDTRSQCSPRHADRVGGPSVFLRRVSVGQYGDELGLRARARRRLSLNRANIRDSGGRWTSGGSKVVPFEQRFEQASPPSAGGVTALRPVSHRARSTAGSAGRHRGSLWPAATRPLGTGRIHAPPDHPSPSTHTAGEP